MASNPFTTGGSSDFDWITGFLKSGAEGIPEVIGITPSTETLQFRQDHPISGIVSEMAGFAVPYGGWFLGATKIPRIAKAISKIGDAINSPIGTAVKKELAIFAPFEAGRVAASQVLGDNSLSEEVGSSILNLALGAGVSGLVGGVAAAGLRDPALPTIFPGLNIDAPVVLQARHMKGLLDSGKITPDFLPKANLAYKTALKEARKEELPQAFKYVAPLLGDEQANPAFKGLESQLNRWFRPTAMPGNKSLQIRAFTNNADKNFAKAEDWTAEAGFAGLSKEDWAHGQYFRSITFNPTKAAQMPKVVDNRITKGMDSVGKGWFMAREADDGMFVLAKKYNGEVGKADPTDKWLLFKTDQPGRFVPDNQKWLDATVALSKWDPINTVNVDGGLVYNTTRNATREIPMRNYQGVLSHPKLVQQVIDKLGPVGSNELFTRMREQFRAVFAPRAYQFAKTPRANWISMMSKMSYDYADNLVNELINGIAKIDPGKQVFFGHISNVRGPILEEIGMPPLRPTTDKLSEEQFGQVFDKYIRPGKVDVELASKDFQAGDINTDQLDLIKAFDAIDNITTTNTGKAEEAVGKRPTKWLKGHGGWSHIWEGDSRIPILNEKGQEVFLAAGPNKRAAQKIAEDILAENPGWKLGRAYSKSEIIEKMLKHEPIDESISPTVLSPSWILERSGMGGYKWWNKTPTKEEFLKDYENGLRSRWRYQANLATDDLLMPQMERLKRESTAAYKQIVDRRNADAGIQGLWGRQINRAVDAYLAPIIGEQSATKIVGLTNTTLMNFQLGAMNLAFPAVNLLTFIQTTLPEVAMVLNALPDRLAPYYSHFMAGGGRGPVGGLAVLQPLKLTFQALKAMKRPSDDVAEFLSWAYNNRTLEPRMVEGYIGEATTKFKDIYKAGQSLSAGKGLPEGFDFLSWLRATSEWLPANSERLARTHTAVMGYIVARDLLRKGGQGLSKKQMFEFAKQFTEKTMYLYNAADKPRILTNPVGSGLGLFKNWMFNYMASMGQYTQEAFLKRNFSPLLWQTAGTFAVGGLSSTPIYWAADIFAKAFGHEDALSAAYDEFGVDDGWFNPADGVMFGLPALLTGISFYSQVQAPGANPTRDAVSMFDAVIFDRFQAMRGAVGGAIDHWSATGDHPGKDAHTRLQMARAFAPSTIYRAMSVTSDGDVLSPVTGYPMVKDLSLYEQMLYRLKLNPVDVDKAMAVSNRLYAKREERKATVMKLGEAFANAQLKGDGAEMALIMRQAFVWGIDGSSVLRSAMARVSKHQDDMITRGYKPQDRAIYENVLGG